MLSHVPWKHAFAASKCVADGTSPLDFLYLTHVVLLRQRTEGSFATSPIMLENRQKEEFIYIRILVSTLRMEFFQSFSRMSALVPVIELVNVLHSLTTSNTPVVGCGRFLTFSTEGGHKTCGSMVHLSKRSQGRLIAYRLR
jgi:hypothetical protein